MLYIRSFLIENLSIEATGIWQALWTISNLCMTLITTALGTYLLPTMSGINSKATLNKEIKQSLKILIPTSLTGLCLFYIVRDFIILTLYSSEFITMRDLLGWQLVGILFKTIGWLFSMTFVAQGLVKLSVITEIIFALSWCILVTLLVRAFNLDGAVYAFALNSFFYLITVGVLYLKKV